MRTALIIPALNEEASIGAVVSGFLRPERDDGSRWIDEVVVADNGSTDGTRDAVLNAGGTVVYEPTKGYGAACLTAIAYLEKRLNGPPDVVVFADGDGANVPEEVERLIRPIERGEVSMVLGSRVRLAVPGSLTRTQKFGNAFATALLSLFYGVRQNDLGPFRAISWGALSSLAMEDMNFGWTVEMQIKAARAGLVTREIDVQNLHRMSGRSKVGGTFRGVIGAGTKIIWTLIKYR